MKKLLNRVETIITLFVDGHIFWWFELRKEKNRRFGQIAIWQGGDEILTYGQWLNVSRTLTGSGFNS